MVLGHSVSIHMLLNSESLCRANAPRIVESASQRIIGVPPGPMTIPLVMVLLPLGPSDISSVSDDFESFVSQFV